MEQPFYTKHVADDTEETPGIYIPKNPENTLLHLVVRENWQTFVDQIESGGGSLPFYILREFDSYLRCGILAHGFLRFRCDGDCKKEKLVPLSCKRRGFCPSCAGRKMGDTAAYLTDFVLPHVPYRQWVLTVPQPLRYWMASSPALTTRILEIIMRSLNGYFRKKTKGKGISGAVPAAATFIQRYGSSANLNLHFHILLAEGVFGASEEVGRASFHPVTAPSNENIKQLVSQIGQRIIRYLQKKGYITKDELSVTEAEDPAENQSPLSQAQAASIQQKIAFGERAGLPVRRLGKIWDVSRESVILEGVRLARAGGFTLHANVSIESDKRAALEKLVRYMARPPIALERMSLSPEGNIHYCLKKPYSDGTTHLIFSPLEFIEKLVALVAKPRAHLVRYHGCLAPHSKLRKLILPNSPDMDIKQETKEAREIKPRRKYYSWSDLLKRVFSIEIERCSGCGGNLKFITAIFDRNVIVTILSHLKLPTNPIEISPSKIVSGFS